MAADSALRPFRVLSIVPHAAASIAQVLRARYTNVTVVEVTTRTVLMAAVANGPYDAICLHYPLPWIPMPSVTQILRQWLPTCPILPFAPSSHGLVLHRLSDAATDAPWAHTA